MDAALVFQALVNAHLHLRGSSMMNRVNRRANEGGKARLDQERTAHNHEDPESLGVSRRRLRNSVEVSAIHRATW